MHYLFNKVHNNPLPSPTAVIDYDVYGDDNRARMRLLEESKEDYHYFFITRVERVIMTICGSWRCTSSIGQKIFLDGDDRRRDHIIGLKRSFNFGRWVMDEYRLDGCLLDPKNTVVLCRIKNDKPAGGAQHLQWQ
ncbi:hypothetical protein QYF36_004879 [Acer negundo]|nr:hypothetical protein QYF36_004879 [Acer negundo]